MSTTTNYSQQPTAEQVRLGEQHKLDNSLAPFPGTHQDQKRDDQLGNQQPGQQLGTDQSRVGEQQRFDNSHISGPGTQQQHPLDNSQTGPNVTGTQTDNQQPGYAQQLYAGVSNLVGSAAGVVGYGTNSNDQQQAPHAATRRVKDLEHRGGVGSLPGTPNEDDVVRLPEERAHPDPLSESSGPLTGGRLDDAAQTAAYASTAPVGSGVHAHTGGSTVGSNLDNHHGLGMGHQKSTALAPGAGASTNIHDTSATHRQTGTDHRDSSAIMPHRDDRGPGVTTTTAATHPVQAIKERTGRDTDDTHRDTAASHPIQSLKDRTTANNDNTRGDTSHHPNIDTSRQGEHSTTSASADSPSKPKFMDKVKGEAKIVMGKVQKNAEKVEEGKALKTGGNINTNTDTTI